MPPSVAKDTKLTSYYKISSRNKKKSSYNWVSRKMPNNPNLDMARGSKIGPIQLELKTYLPQDRKPQSQGHARQLPPQNFHSLPLFGATVVPRTYSSNPFSESKASRASSNHHSHQSTQRDHFNATYEPNLVVKEKSTEMPKIESQPKYARKMISADQSRPGNLPKPQIVKGSVWVDRFKKISDNRQRLLQRS
jgi:hypothetical protein